MTVERLVPRRRIPLLVMLVSIVGFALGSQVPARADVNEHQEDFRIRWRPTFGSISLHVVPGTNNLYKDIYETFGWGTTVSMLSLDDPRTEDGNGTYEHELRFSEEIDGYCNSLIPDGWFTVVGQDMPPDYQLDGFGEPNEYTWWMITDLLEQDHVYDIEFQCQALASTSDTSFKYQGQIGHCHDDGPLPCDPVTTYSDNTTRFVPEILGHGPSDDNQGTKTYTIDNTFNDNPSFEDPLSSKWSVSSGTLTRNCTGSAYHGSCFVRFAPADEGFHEHELTLRYDPGSPQDLALEPVHSEFMVRCPSASAGDCLVRVIVRGFDSAGNPTGPNPDGSTCFTPTTLIEEGTGWYGLRCEMVDQFAAGTVKWRFVVEVSPDGTKLDVDYHQQAFDVVGP